MRECEPELKAAASDDCMTPSPSHTSKPVASDPAIRPALEDGLHFRNALFRAD